MTDLLLSLLIKYITVFNEEFYLLSFKPFLKEAITSQGQTESDLTNLYVTLW